MIKDVRHHPILLNSNQSISITITDEIYISAARRKAINFADKMGFAKFEIDRIAIVVSELGNNLIKYATKNKTRQLIFQCILKENKNEKNKQMTFEIMAIDAGPGISNITQCLQDGYSTGDTAGTGLGAVSRLSDFFTIYSLVGMGTVFLAHIHNKSNSLPSADFLEIAGICLPITGEEISGDSWSFYQTDERSLILVADGLGHGPIAAEASQLACEVFQENVHLPCGQIVTLINKRLRTTRGAVIAISEINKKQQTVTFAGLGNIAGIINNGNKMRHMVSHDGTAGGGQYVVQEYVYAWNEKSILVMHSDGLTSRWTLQQYPGLSVRYPSVIAGLLYRDFCRGNDDVTVVVAKQNTIYSTIGYE
jgi:anti-sigma regulatory factor (Ser/Thr protein kinase)